MNARELKWTAIAVLLMVSGFPPAVWSLYQFHLIVVARENAKEVTAVVLKVGEIQSSFPDPKKLCRPTLSILHQGKIIQHQTQYATPYLCYQRGQNVKVWFRYRAQSKSSIVPTKQVPGWIWPLVVLLITSTFELIGGVLAFIVFLRYIARREDAPILPEMKE